MKSGKPWAWRVLTKIEIGQPEDCWRWLAAHNVPGYGVSVCPDGSHTNAHRAVYRVVRGEPPDGYVIDHLCGNRSCVNPNHLEAVTQSENMRRAKSKPFCPWGHPKDGWLTREGRRFRYCKACKRASEVRRKQKRGAS